MKANEDKQTNKVVKFDGLTTQEVNQRISEGKTNFVKKTVGKSYLSIILDNVLTAFNLIGLVVFALMIIARSWGNTPFYLIILLNTTVGVVQEIRAKHTVQRLSIMTAPTANVIRDGQKSEISVDSIVLDDVIMLSAGKQIPADSIVLEGKIETNESLLTGESLPIIKNVDDTLLSGSFVVSGSCLAKVVHIGCDNYVEQLSLEAKKYKKPRSELMVSIGKIIKVIAILVFPMGIMIFLTELLGQHHPWQIALQDAGGSMIGMIPSGMVLLTTLTLAVSVIKMSKKNALVQDLYCIEMLARVNVLCLDKTGTITDGTMTVENVETLSADYQPNVLIKTLLTATNDSNNTANALNKKFDCDKILPYTDVLAFSSDRKLSACKVDFGTIILGASEFVLDKKNDKIDSLIKHYTSLGLRTLLLGVGDGNINNFGNITPVALIVLSDTIRSDAKDIIKWFADNEVEIKVISGDNAETVSVIAQKVNVKGADKYISLDGLSDEEVIAVANKYTVFGRVKPNQKALLIKTIKDNGNTVAMTGDGVNDILAMRQADCAIAIAEGSEAARSVAHLVLLDSKFSSMPNVVKEGRQVVNNIQNASSLFLMKTMMTLITTIFILIIGAKYPFQPKNLYIIEFCVIGLPGFFLALRKNEKLIRGSFVQNIFWATVPKGIALAVSVMLVYLFARISGLKGNHLVVTTLAMINMSFAGVLGLAVLCYPFDKLKTAVVLGSFVSSIVGLFLLDYVFALLNSKEQFMSPINKEQFVFILLSMILVLVIMMIGEVIRIKKDKEFINGKISTNL